MTIHSHSCPPATGLAARLIGPVAGTAFAAIAAAPTLGAEPPSVRNWSFTPDGSARVRYEFLADRYARGFDGSDRIVQTQLRAGLRAGAGPFSLRLEALDGGNFMPGPDSEAGPEPRTSAELINAFASLSLASGKLRVDAGRFTFDLGSRRLIAESGTSNFPARFEGARAIWTPVQSLVFTAFETRVGRRDLQTVIGANPLPARPDQGLRGLHAAWTPTGSPVEGQAYWIQLREPGARHLATHGLRVWRAPHPGRLDADIEVMLQSGRAVSASQRVPVRAYGLDVQAGYTFDQPWRTRLAAHYIFASGNDAADEGRIGRFNPLFGSRSSTFGGGGALFGPLDRENIAAAGLSADARREAWRITLRYFNVRLASASDRWRRADLHDPSGASGRAIGDLADLRLDREWLDGRLRARLGAAVLYKDRFARTAPGAPGSRVSAGLYAEMRVRY